MSKTLIIENLPWNNNPYFEETSRLVDVDFKEDLPARFYIYSPNNLAAVVLNEHTATVVYQTFNGDRRAQGEEILSFLEKEKYKEGVYIVDFIRKKIVLDFAKKQVIDWGSFRMIPPPTDNLNSTFTYFTVFKTKTKIIRKSAILPSICTILHLANNSFIKPNGKLEEFGCDVATEIINQHYVLEYTDREYISVYSEPKKTIEIDNKFLQKFEEEYYSAVNFLVEKTKKVEEEKTLKLSEVKELDFEMLGQDEVLKVIIDKRTYNIDTMKDLQMEIRNKSLYVFCTARTENLVNRVLQGLQIPTKYVRFLNINSFENAGSYGLLPGGK